MEEFLRTLTIDLPEVALGLILVAAAVEYLFPPFPGDTILLLGFLLAGRGRLPAAGTACAAIGGSVLGALLAYGIGRRFGAAYFLLRRSRRAQARLARLRAAVDRHGPRLLLVNRFLPGLRGVFLYLAGMSGMRPRVVFLYSTASNFLWVALLAWIGLRVEVPLGDARTLLRHYGLGILVLIALMLLTQAGWRRWIEPRSE